jgi:16S rRNA (guanine527-N7)-methyltransferase
MAALSQAEISDILLPFCGECSETLLQQLSDYLDLLVKWNARTNLSAVREPREMVKRHFGESLFAAGHLPQVTTLLDLGSGAGFPGLPIQLARPTLQVTLAESQNKKASFLREVVRTLGLRTEVFADRVEKMAADRRFEAVTLRAVDQPGLALSLARARIVEGGLVVQLSAELEGAERSFLIPGTMGSFVNFIR